MVFQKVAPELLPWPVGFSCCCDDGVVFQKLEWCSKKLSQNPHSVFCILLAEIRVNIFYCINTTGLDTSYNNIK